MFRFTIRELLLLTVIVALGWRGGWIAATLNASGKETRRKLLSLLQWLNR